PQSENSYVRARERWFPGPFESSSLALGMRFDLAEEAVEISCAVPQLAQVLQRLFGHTPQPAESPKALSLEVTASDKAGPTLPSRPLFVLEGHRPIWGELSDHRLLISDGQVSARVEYLSGTAQLTLHDRGQAACY